MLCFLRPSPSLPLSQPDPFTSSSSSFPPSPSSFPNCLSPRASVLVSHLSSLFLPAVQFMSKLKRGARNPSSSFGSLSPGHSLPARSLSWKGQGRGEESGVEMQRCKVAAASSCLVLAGRERVSLSSPLLSSSSSSLSWTSSRAIPSLCVESLPFFALSPSLPSRYQSCDG